MLAGVLPSVFPRVPPERITGRALKSAFRSTPKSTLISVSFFESTPGRTFGGFPVAGFLAGQQTCNESPRTFALNLGQRETSLVVLTKVRYAPPCTATPSKRQLEVRRPLQELEKVGATGAFQEV